MPANEKLTARVRVALSTTPRVEEKKMFGGIAFMVNGKMCVTVGADRIMCRVDPALNDSLASRRGAETMTMNGRTYTGYIRVDQSAVRTEKQLAEWVGLALDFNSRATRSARKAGEKAGRNARA